MITAALGIVREELQAMLILKQAGAIAPLTNMPRMTARLRSAGLAAMPTVFADLYGDRYAVVDSLGSMSYQDLALNTNALMRGLALDAEQQPTIGVMCRNSRYFVMSFLAALGLGARLVLLNVDMGPTQLGEVWRREHLDVIVLDAEFEHLVPQGARRIIASFEGHEPDPSDESDEVESIDRVIATTSSQMMPKPAHRPDIVVLTSGSTGTPRGATRASGRPSLTSLAGFFQKIPLRGTDRVLIAPPLFHGWGLIACLSSLMAGATVVLERRFSASRTAELVSRHSCTALFVVPTMLRRLQQLDGATLEAMKRAPLRIIASGGARLEPALVQETLSAFGPLLYNFYGATEASMITIATPADLQAEPACAGTPPLGVRIAIIKDGVRQPTGAIGEVHVGSANVADGYTDGTSKARFDGMMATGDAGWIDATGRLFIVGRTDGMIISGGENVYPEEVEQALITHPSVADVKVTSVVDADFGERLRAYVVAAPGRRVSAATLKKHVGSLLARTHVPRDFVLVSELPRTSTGKVSKATLDLIQEQTRTAKQGEES